MTSVACVPLTFTLLKKLVTVAFVASPLLTELVVEATVSAAPVVALMALPEA
ncbi:hypothetical protein D9M68_999850 [compost metagenome]